MAKRKPTCPEHKPNETRSKAKLKRNRGILAMEKAGMNQIEWTRHHDPLFQVGGIKRHIKLKGE